MTTGDPSDFEALPALVHKTQREYVYTCHDCGVDEGEYHLPGCDEEICPWCGKQYITCECAGGTEESTTDEERQEALERKGRWPFVAFPNVCGRCGELSPELFMVPDEEWEHYIPPAQRDGLLCQACYDRVRALVDGAERQGRVP
jgi:hypothetical protein